MVPLPCSLTLSGTGKAPNLCKKANKMDPLCTSCGLWFRPIAILRSSFPPVPLFPPFVLLFPFFPFSHGS